MSSRSIESKLLIIIDKLKSIENRLSTIEHIFIPQVPKSDDLPNEEILFKPRR
jgi:hypothetical protein